MITANLTLREKIHYASIGEYKLTPEDMQEARDEELQMRYDAGWEAGNETANDESNSLLMQLSDEVEELMDELDDLSKDQIYEKLREIHRKLI